MIQVRLLLSTLVITLILQGCSQSRTDLFIETAERPSEATTFLSILDQEIESSDSENIVYARIDEFPYLRINRFFDELKHNLESDEQRADWVNSLRELAVEARKSEVYSLTDSALQAIADKLNLLNPLSRGQLWTRTLQEEDQLFSYDRKHSDFYQAVIDSAEVEDDYSTPMRVFGLYPLAYLPVAFVTDRAYDKIRTKNKRRFEEQVLRGSLVRYTYERQREPKANSAREILQNHEKNSLGLIELSESDQIKLAVIFAPDVIQDTASSYDRIGKLHWKGSEVSLDPNQPAIYYYLTHVMLGSEPVIQINYSFWYTAREGESAPWFERGEFDGLTLRVTIDWDGEPVMVDIMNSCGCYHFFVPSRNTFAASKELPFEIDPLVFDWLPPEYPTNTLSLFVNSGWHQVDLIRTNLFEGTPTAYELVPYGNLEELPYLNSQTRNIFDNKGIFKGSYRIEPYIFFSMGIPKVGFMRQRGHHPVKMLGRDHFDNPEIINENFILNTDN